MPTTTSVLQGVTINEIHEQPSGASQDLNGNGIGDSADEFVELFNTSGASVNLNGWELWETGTLKHTFGPGDSIAAGGTFTVVDANGAPGPIINVGGPSTFSDANMSPGSSDVWILYDPTGAGSYIVLAASGGAANLTLAVNALLASHPTASQIGSTETTPATTLGNSWYREPEGDAGFTVGAPTAGAPVCFLAGTRIATPYGQVAVETLVPGAMVETSDGPRAVKWLGRQTVSTRFGPAERLMPVRFAAGSLGEGVPHSDLTVTADHGMLVDAVICHAGALVNGTTITRVPLAEMGDTYIVYHIETEDHEIILANGAPAETFIDNVSRRVFDNFAEFEALYGDVPEMAELPYPRAMSARQVPGRISRKLSAAQAA